MALKEKEKAEEQPPVDTGTKQVDQNGYIEHKVNFEEQLSQNLSENNQSWDEEDSYECYGEEFANCDDSDYFDELAALENADQIDIFQSEDEEYDINGNLIPKEEPVIPELIV